MARRAIQLLLAATCVASCATPGVTKAPAKRPTVAVADVAASAVKPAPAPSRDVATKQPTPFDPARRAALVASLANALAASRAAKLTATLGAASGALSGSTAGLISNNGGSVVSNNGAKIVSDNGGGIISDNGGGVVTRSGLHVLDAAATGSQLQDASFVPYHSVSETALLVYVVDADSPTTGHFRTYDRTAYHAQPPQTLPAALVDEFAWDDVTQTTGFEGHEDELAVTYNLIKRFSKRVPFADRILSSEILRFTFGANGNLGATSIGWRIAFDMNVTLANGPGYKASFNAVAGEKDLLNVNSTQGSPLALPVHLVLTGASERGKYTGSIDNRDQLHVDIAHQSTDGSATHLVIDTGPGGTGHETIEVPAARLALSLTLDAVGGGSGVLQDLSGGSAVPLGPITWTPDGMATIALPDGTPLQAQLF